MPLDDSNPKAAVDAAQQLQALLENAPLHLVNSKAEFDKRTSPGEDSSLSLPIALSENSRLADPRVVALDVEAQLVSSVVAITIFLC